MVLNDSASGGVIPWKVSLIFIFLFFILNYLAQVLASPTFNNAYPVQTSTNRLRHVTSIAAHKLKGVSGAGCKVFFTVSLPEDKGDGYRLAYRSEAVDNCVNVQWMPINHYELRHFGPWANADQVLLKFHVLSSGSASPMSTQFQRPSCFVVNREPYEAASQCILEANITLSNMPRIQSPIPIAAGQECQPNLIIFEFSPANEYGVYCPDLDANNETLFGEESQTEKLNFEESVGYPSTSLSLIEFRNQVESIITVRKRILMLQQRRAETVDWLNSHTSYTTEQSSGYEGTTFNAISVVNAMKEKRLKLIARYQATKASFEKTQKKTVCFEKTAVAAGQALMSTLQILRLAHKRIAAGKSTLEGQEGHGRLKVALKELIGRRCLMTLQAANVLRFVPSSVRVVPVGGQLDTCLDAQWTGGPMETRFEIYAPGSNYQINDASMQHGRDEMKLTVLGMTLNPAVWKHAFDPEGYEWDPGEDRNAAVVLGIVAALVDKLAGYLNVPLRYPLLLRGSTSAIMDNHAPVSIVDGGKLSSLEMKTDQSKGLYSHIANGKIRNHRTPVEYPLYCQSNRDRPRFAVGVFLLNKDVIQLLQSHGMSSAGPNQLLQNLHMLVAAAQAGLPPGHEGFDWIQP